MTYNVFYAMLNCAQLTALHSQNVMHLKLTCLGTQLMPVYHSKTNARSCCCCHCGGTAESCNKMKLLLLLVPRQRPVGGHHTGCD